MGAHTWLVVEDQDESVPALLELLDVLGYRAVHAKTALDARRIVEERDVCGALVDLQALQSVDSIKPHPEVGLSIIRHLRAVYPGVTVTGGHCFPILVFSGHAREHKFVRRAWAEGADDFLHKPIDDDDTDIAGTLKTALLKAGRHDHAGCATVSQLARCRPVAGEGGDDGGPLRLAVTGKPIGDRLEVLVNGRAAAVRTQPVVALLGLIEGRARDAGWIPKEELGGRAGSSYKVVSDLLADLKPYLPSGVRLVENRRGVGYRLGTDVVVERVDARELRASSVAAIRVLASKLDEQNTCTMERANVTRV